MSFCRYCGKTIPESVPSCSHCGGVQVHQAHPAAKKKRKIDFSPYITLLFLMSSVLIFFSDDIVDQTMMWFLGVVGVTCIVSGFFDLRNATQRERAGIAGVLMSSALLLAVAGTHMK